MEVVEDEGAWVASVPDLPGCNSFGTTATDAINNVQEAKELWLRSQFENSGEIPEPTDEEDFSGKFVLRIPKQLHRSLAYQAQKQGVSLNHYASHLLSQRQALNAVRSLLTRRIDFLQHAQNTWMHQHETPHFKILSMGTTLPGDVGLVVHLSRPAAKHTFKVPESTEQQYQLPHALSK